MPCDGGGVGVEQVSSVGSSRLWVAIGLKDFADMLLLRFFVMLKSAHLAHQGRSAILIYSIYVYTYSCTRIANYEPTVEILCVRFKAKCTKLL